MFDRCPIDFGLMFDRFSRVGHGLQEHWKGAGASRVHWGSIGRAFEHRRRLGGALEEDVSIDVR